MNSCRYAVRTFAALVCVAAVFSVALTNIAPAAAAAGTRPTLEQATLVGGTGDDADGVVACDDAGNVYVAGSTSSTGGLLGLASTTIGPLGSGDLFVAKLSQQGAHVEFVTKIGGSGSDRPTGIAVGAQGTVFVVGSTASIDFPTISALQSASGGGAEGFALALDASGSALRYATYLGGSADDTVTGLAIDSEGEAVVGGYTKSGNFPAEGDTAPPSPQTAGFVAKLAVDGGEFVFARRLGDKVNGVAVSAPGDLLVAGSQIREGFGPVGVFYEIGPSGASVNRDAELVGPGACVAVDASGVAFVGGSLSTQGALFVSRFDPGATLPVYTAQFGGVDRDVGESVRMWAIATDGRGNAFAAGGTTGSMRGVHSVMRGFAPSPNFHDGAPAAFVVALNPGGRAYLSSAFLTDLGALAYSVATCGAGHVFVAGVTTGYGFLQKNPLEPQPPLDRNAFLLDVGMPAPGPAPVITSVVARVGPDGTRRLVVRGENFDSQALFFRDTYAFPIPREATASITLKSTSKIVVQAGSSWPSGTLLTVVNPDGGETSAVVP